MFWNIVFAIASYALQLVLTPKPPNAKPKSLEDFQAPTADEGRELGVGFGTNDFPDPNVTWYGDLKRSAIKGARRYGLFGPRQVLGYKYSLGMQMGLCHGPVDAVYGIRVGDKDAWTGISRGGRININKSSLFGGDKSEGGIKGAVDICMGAPDQLQNDYLLAKLGDTVSAYRGVLTVVLRQVYLGTSNYIKPWEFRIQRVYVRSDGSEQWYKAKAGIGAVTMEKTAIFFALDLSSNMAGDRLANMKIAMISILTTLRDNSIGDIPVLLRACHSLGTFITGNIPGAYDDLVAWVDALTASGDTNFFGTGTSAQSFFNSWGDKRKIFVLLTHEVPDNAFTDATVTAVMGIEGIEASAITIDDVISAAQQFDNTSDDGVPVVQGDDAQSMIDAMSIALSFEGSIDMNPAHIIRECITDALWGMGYTDDDVDDTSFTYSADTFFAEKFGLSLRWVQEDEIEKFVTNVLGHVDAYLYGSRSTGKFVLKPVRDDYDIDLIPLLTEDDIIEFTEIKRRQKSEAVSSVLVKYYNRAKRKPGAHRVTNTAQAMQSTGNVPPATREYPGINQQPLAIRVGTRDVLSLGSGLISGRIIVKPRDDLNPGDPFRIVSARYKLSGEVQRVTGLRFGDGRDNKMGITLFQDVFKLGSATIVDDGASGGGWEPPSSDPLPVSPRLIWEMPYREARQMVGDADLASLLSGNTGAGLLQVAGSAPSDDAANADIQVDTGSGYDGTEQMDFAPGGSISGALAIDATSVTVSAGVDLDDTAVGLLAAIGDGSRLGTEVVRIDGVAGNVLTVARGCLDTVPMAHADGAAFVLFDDLSTSDFETYATGQSIDVKLLTNTGQGQLALGAAPTNTVDFDSRAVRPIAPKNAQLNGIGYGTIDATLIDPIPATWVRRNRLTELTPLGWTDADVSPEASQTTTLRLTDLAGSEVFAYSGIGGTSQNIDPADFGALVDAYVVFDSERDGYAAWQTYRLRLLLAAGLLLSGDEQSGADHIALSGDMAPGNLRLSGST